MQTSNSIYFICKNTHIEGWLFLGCDANHLKCKKLKKVAAQCKRLCAALVLRPLKWSPIYLRSFLMSCDVDPALLLAFPIPIVSCCWLECIFYHLELHLYLHCASHHASFYPILLSVIICLLLFCALPLSPENSWLLGWFLCLSSSSVSFSLRGSFEIS